MPRKPTGNPPGRPPAALRAQRRDQQKRKAIKEALKMFEESGVELTPYQAYRLKQNAEASPEGAESWNDVPFPAHALVPFKDLQPLTSEELAKASDRIKGLLGAAVAGFAPRVPELLERLAHENPEKALKLFNEMQEYLVPKLTRTETSGTIDHRATFVPVEAREADPRPKPALPGPTTVTVIEALPLDVDTDGTDKREQGPGPATEADPNPTDDKD